LDYKLSSKHACEIFQQNRTIFKEVSSFLVNAQSFMIRHLLILSAFALAAVTLEGQTVNPRIEFGKGQTLNIRLEVRASVAQQAAGQAIDFAADAVALHSYKVTNQAKGQSTLHHTTKKIAFNFDGMGQKRSFDSDNKTDIQGPFGDPVKSMLSSTFSMTLDEKGKVVMVNSGKKEAPVPDDRLAIIFNMLKDITDAVYPPKKGESSFFKVFPDKPAVNKGDVWTESGQDETGKYSTEYILSDVLDSSIIVDFKGISTTTTKNMVMGREAVTTLNSTSTGKIILDGVNGLIREKRVTVESNGTTEAMGGTVPVSSKTTIVIKVSPE